MPHALISALDVQLYRTCDLLSTPIILAMVVFSPWAFGTTQPWSVWCMNMAGYALGLLLACKCAIRWAKGYRPQRWYSAPLGQDQGAWLRPETLQRFLLAVTVAILGFTLVSALNARATYVPGDLSFAYHKHIPWLPHSMDSQLTWYAFWQYLGLACSFWAIHDWLLGKTGAEERVPRHGSIRLGDASAFPARLRALLWVLAINGALLGLEGIVQRQEGSGRLLFIAVPRVNPAAVTQFGPWAYRSNAAQYFNLLWPVCLGFWWTLQRTAGKSRIRQHWVLLAAAIMAACPLMSTSRGGAGVTIGILVAASVFLLGSQLLFLRQRQTALSKKIASVGLVVFVLVSLTAGIALGWKSLFPRLSQIPENYDQREAMYARALPMAADFPLFGTGPGTFKTVFQLYRFSTDTYWPAQLHNDWLETRLTFGWIGSTLITLAFLAVFLRWFARGGIHGGRRFVTLSWMAVAGVFFHARWDLPFQIHSIVFLFLVICAILFSLSRRGQAP